MTENHVGFNIRTLSNLIHRRINQMVAEEEETLTAHQVWVLKYLISQAADRDTIQRDVEKQFSIRRSTASHMLQLMERSGYILRVSVPEDARLKKLVPTRKGLDACDRMMERLDRFESMLQDGISPEELQQFLRILRIMEKNMM
jgi:MarR family transcriptional repressor of mepA